MSGRGPEDPPDLAERALARRKREDSALAVPAAGALLLVSPVINVFAPMPDFAGIPAIFLYIFAVWTGLILLTWSLARRLIGSDDRES